MERLERFSRCMGGLFLALPFLFLSPMSVSAASEHISSFDANIHIENSGDLLIEESIRYDFSSNQKHGIFREIPVVTAGWPDVKIDVVGVQDAEGNPYHFVVSKGGDTTSIKIGDANQTVSGQKMYVIRYRVSGEMRAFADHDELYWNVTGNGWPVGIGEAKAKVSFPEGIQPTKHTCYTGIRGSMLSDCSGAVDASNTLVYQITRPLQANEGLTLVVGIPKGVVEEAVVALPIATRKEVINNKNDWVIVATMVSIFGIFFAFIFFRIYIAIFRRDKVNRLTPVTPRELKGRPIVAEYRPPAGLRPIDVGTLLDRSVDLRDISAVIVDLAVRGYLKIRYTIEPIRFWPDKKDFEITKLKEGADLVHPADKAMFGLLFSGRDVVTLSVLKGESVGFSDKITALKKESEEFLYKEGYFDFTKKAKGDEEKKKWGIIFGIAFISVFVSYLSIPFLFLLIVSMIMLIRTKRFEKQLTEKGVTAFATILGFREYLSMVQKEKYAMMNAPQMNAETFEEFLSYAMVLGVEEQWAKQFEGMYLTQPTWYEGQSGDMFSSIVLSNQLSLFGSSFNQAVAVASPSSSSGFGGGGSSGGGGGGGGGGSW